MNSFKKIAIFVILLLITVTIIPSTVQCGDGDKERIVKELTKSFKADGWSDLNFKYSGNNTVSIHHAGIIQREKLTEGQLVSGLGAILTPDVVAKLKKSGFKNGIFIDGKGRKYPFEISNKYSNQLQDFHKKLSGEK